MIGCKIFTWELNMALVCRSGSSNTVTLVLHDSFPGLIDQLILPGSARTVFLFSYYDRYKKGSVLLC